MKKTFGRSKKGEEKNEAPDEMEKKNAEIQLLTVKLKKMDREKQALNRRLAKAGLTEDVAEEAEEVNDDDQAKKSDENGEENKENGETVEKDKDVEKIEAELKEIEVVKYKMQEDMTVMKKEYEQQLEIINFRVFSTSFNLKT